MQPARNGWIARLFRRNTRPTAPPKGPTEHPGQQSERFTAETHPNLSPEARAILNTPAKDLDPAVLGLLLSGLARHIAANMPPEAGMDERTVLTQLAARFGMRVRQATPEELAALQAQPAQAASQDAERDPQQAANAQAAQPTPQQTPPDTPKIPPAATLPVDAPATRQHAATNTHAITPDAASPAEPRFSRRPGRIGDRESPLRTRRRHPATRRLSSRPHRTFHQRHHAPPTRRLTYAACAGPP